MNATYFRAPTLYRDHLAHRPGWNYWIVNPELRYVLITLNDPDDFLVFSKGSDEGIAPTDDFGMNTGMDDASNLAWKLAALVQGWGGPKLLQSYEIERRPIAERNT